MLNRAIIEIRIDNDEYNKERAERIKKRGLRETYIQFMREMYNAIEDTYGCKHIRIEAIFSDSFNDFGIMHSLDEETGKKYEIFFFKYYLEFEDDVDFTDGNDLYDLFDIDVTDVNGDEISIGWIGSKEVDFDLYIEDGVDWTLGKNK